MVSKSHFHNARLIGRLDILILVMSAPLSALLRELFPGTPLRLENELPYWIGSIFSVLVWLYWRPDRIVWQFRRNLDVWLLFVFAFCGPLLGMVAGFAFDRLEGIPRSVPFIQATLVFLSMVSFRFALSGYLASTKLDREALRSANSRLGPQAGYDSSIAYKHMIVGHFFQVGAIAKLLQSEWAKNSLGGRIFDSALTLEPGLSDTFLSGVRVMGPVSSFSASVLNLENHGYQVKTLLLASPLSAFHEQTWQQISAVCEEKNIEIIGLNSLLDQSILQARDPREHETILSRGNSQLTSTLAQPRHGYLQDTDPQVEAITPFHALRAKRVFDFCTSLLLLILFSPLLLLASLLVKMADPDQSVIFWQYRPGFKGKPFLLYKFRTLSEVWDPVTMVAKNLESRHNWLGKFMRKLRLDELPQLWNILRGDMSFVGPRPLLPHDQPTDLRRLSVKPGLVGWAQVNGGTSLSVNDKNALDLYYIRHFSFLLDLKILALTVLRWHSMDVVRPPAIDLARQELIG
jgi:lipopolysaccharide/colanic/teichoic acid biosynthesis glycosyltransferase